MPPNRISINLNESPLNLKSTLERGPSLWKYLKLIGEGFIIALATIITSWALDAVIIKLGGNKDSIYPIGIVSKYVSLIFFILYSLMAFIGLLSEFIRFLKQQLGEIFK